MSINPNSSNSQNKRIEYLDFCKVLAIFLVTVAHCAQRISGIHFPELLLSKDSFISINMPIFMIASGFVMNVDKMRKTNTKDYLLSKFIRLIIPMTSWYVVLCLVSCQPPQLNLYWEIYWYLGALFVCLTTVKILADYISNNVYVCVISIVLLSFVPLILLERSCFMIPFLWTGYYLRSQISRIGKLSMLIMLIAYLAMYYYWDVSFSIYLAPFHIWDVSYNSVFALFFRLLIGVVGGVLVISLSKILIDTKYFGWMRYVAKYGPYTLVFYTMSFVLNTILARVLWHIHFYVQTPGWLDLVSIVVTILMMIFMYYFQIIAKKYKWSRLVFLGETNS